MAKTPRRRAPLPPLRLGGPQALGPTGDPDLYAVMIDVRRDAVDDNGQRFPWAAIIVSHAEEPQQVTARVVDGDTLDDIWQRAHDRLEQIADEVERTVATMWSLDGDTAAWAPAGRRARAHRRLLTPTCQRPAGC